MLMGKQKGQAEAKIDMTPLIDMTFLLIVFLVSTTQMSEIEKAAKLVLPIAPQANPEGKGQEDRDRLVVNIEQETGDIVIANQRRTPEEVRRILKREADRERDAQGYAKRAVFVRADHRIEFGKVLDFMAMCKEPEIGIWRMSFKAIIPESTKEGLSYEADR